MSGEDVVRRCVGFRGSSNGMLLIQLTLATCQRLLPEQRTPRGKRSMDNFDVAFESAVPGLSNRLRSIIWVIFRVLGVPRKPRTSAGCLGCAWTAAGASAVRLLKGRVVAAIRCITRGIFGIITSIRRLFVHVKRGFMRARSPQVARTRDGNFERRPRPVVAIASSSLLTQRL